MASQLSPHIQVSQPTHTHTDKERVTLHLLCIHLIRLIHRRSLDQIPASILPHFKEAARQLMKDKGAEEALAAALAHISGSKEIVSRSVLSGMSVIHQYKA